MTAATAAALKDTLAGRLREAGEHQSLGIAQHVPSQSNGIGRVPGLMSNGICHAWPLGHSRWSVSGRRRVLSNSAPLPVLAFLLAAGGAGHGPRLLDQGQLVVNG